MSYYSQTLRTRGNSDIQLKVYLKDRKALPKSIEDFKDFCLENAHPNDLIIDDFQIEELRFHDNYQGYFVLYFIGTDGKDDLLEERFNHDEVAGISFEDYKKLKEDFIIGSISRAELKEYLGN